MVKQIFRRLVACLMLTGAALLLGFTPAASAQGWSAPTPVDPAFDTASLSCVSSSLCVAVSSEGGAATFDGTGWSPVTSIDDSSSDLKSVSCTDTTSLFCIAVDYVGDAVIYSNGTWGSPVPIDNNGELESVSCTSSTACYAVDYLGNVLVYTSGSWSAPEPIDADGNGLDSISCVAAPSLFCTAVDYVGNAFTFTGTAWSTATQIESGGSITSVSCTSSSFCAAVDKSGNAFTYNGSWSTSANDSNASLYSVSCSSASSCMAFGSIGFFEYNGSGWSPDYTNSSLLAHGSVSCVPSFCLVGSATGLTASRSGNTWSSVDLISGGAPVGISCAGSFCALIDVKGVAFTLSGGEWSGPAQVAVSENAGFGTMREVSCASNSFCVAVDGQGHAFTYDGISWTSSTIDSGNALTSVSCAGSSSIVCLAADDDGNVVAFRNGSWGAPTSMANSQMMSGSVSCTTGPFCVAVFGQTAYSYNGIAWSAGTPVDGTAVSCAAGPFCLVLTPNEAFGPASTLGESVYSNGAWTTGSTPVSAGFSTGPFSCTSQASCLTVVGNTSFADAGYGFGTGTSNGENIPFTSVSCSSPSLCLATDSSGNVLTYAGGPPTPAGGTASISGESGQILTAATTSWTNSPVAYAYQWDDCNSSGGACTPIPNALANTYSPQSSDIGDTLEVNVAALNAGGASSPATSPPTAVITQAASTTTTTMSPAPTPTTTVPATSSAVPANTSSPTVSGPDVVGQTLTATSGSWSNSPTSYTYAWETCNSAASNCSAIAGATTSTLTLNSGDLNSTIVVEVTAINASGASSAAISAPTSVVQPASPTDRSAPLVSGGLRVGDTLIATAGTWLSSHTPVYAYQWQRCSSAASTTCTTNIRGATSPDYKLSTADKGMYLRLVVTATTTAYGFASAVSKVVGPVEPATGEKVTSAQVKTALQRALGQVSGKRATVTAILKSSGFSLTFASPGPGRVIIDWSTTVSHKTTLIGSATATARAAMKIVLKIKLTTAGRRILKTAKAITVHEDAAFQLRGGNRSTVMKTITLMR